MASDEFNIDLTDDEEEGQSASGDSPIDQEATPEDPIDSDDDGKADDDGSVDDDAERDPDGYIVDPSTSGGTPGDTPVDPPSPPVPEPEYVYVEVVTEEYITDFSPLSLSRYQAAGAVAVAVYDDGTEEVVPWNEVVDPAGPSVDAVNEADAIARATNQHFWHRATDPSGDGAGTGAFVTDVEKDAFLEQATDGWPDWQPEQYDSGGQERADYKPFHNLLQNSQGILLRSALRHIAAFTHSAVTFFDGLGNSVSNVVARFGKDGFLVGKESESHLVGDYHSLQLVYGNAYFYVSDLRDRTGYATYTLYFRGDGQTTSFTLVPALVGNTNVTGITVDGSSISNYTESYTTTGYKVNITPAPQDGSEILITYKTKSPMAKAYTLGVRDPASAVGAMSFAEGYHTRATAYCSHVEGMDSAAVGGVSHAEGLGSYAAGYNSHAESGGKTYGADSHAESGSTAEGECSHAQNRTIAMGAYQTTLGKNNITDTTSAVIVGNGSSSTNRSNALTVDWSGNVTCGTVNGVDVTAISPSGNYLPLSGGTLTGNLSFGSTGKNINMVDGSGFSYPALRDNGSNLWIGATATAAQHHKGGTYISSGHDGSAGKPTIYVSVPNAANNNATNYGVYHTGNKPNLTALPGTLGINNGGTGSAGISISTGASLVTSSSATTVTACSLSKWGPLACLSVTFTPVSSWANGAQLEVGTVAAPENRPSTQVGGGAAGITAGCSNTGNIYARNHTGSARTASTTLSFVYLCDI